MNQWMTDRQTDRQTDMREESASVVCSVAWRPCMALTAMMSTLPCVRRYMSRTHSVDICFSGHPLNPPDR